MNTEKVETETVLITGGRAPVALDLARLFSSRGYRIIIAESIKHHMCRLSRSVDKSYVVPSPKEEPIRFIHALKEIILKEKASCLVPTCEEIFHIAKHQKHLPESCAVFVDSIDKLNQLHNKWLFIKTIQKLEMEFPCTFYLESEEELKQALKNSAFAKVVVKPVYSRFASQVHFLDKGSTPPCGIKISPSTPWLIQEHIDGEHYCSFGVAHSGKLTAHTTYPVTFRAGKGATVHFKHLEDDQVFQWVSRFVNAMNYSGQIAFDFIRQADGKLFAIECNPRATSGIHLFTENENLDQAYFNPQADLCVPNGKLQRLLSFPMWTYSLGSIRTLKELKEWGRAVRTSQDVIFRVNDPWPALYQYIEYAAFWMTSRKRKISLLEATTADLEWNGE